MILIPAAIYGYQYATDSYPKPLFEREAKCVVLIWKYECFFYSQAAINLFFVRKVLHLVSIESKVRDSWL